MAPGLPPRGTGCSGPCPEDEHAGPTGAIPNLPRAPMPPSKPQSGAQNRKRSIWLAPRRPSLPYQAAPANEIVAIQRASMSGFSGHCYITATSRQRGYHVLSRWLGASGFRFGRGPGNGTRGPHGPEPWRGRVLKCPTDSRVVLPNTKTTKLGSFCDLPNPAHYGGFWPRLGPALFRICPSHPQHTAFSRRPITSPFVLR